MELRGDSCAVSAHTKYLIRESRTLSYLRRLEARRIAKVIGHGVRGMKAFSSKLKTSYALLDALITRQCSSLRSAR